MSELPHFFKLKVTKGDQTVEVEIGGAEKFVTPGFQDIKSAALTFLHREAGQRPITNQGGPLMLEVAPPACAMDPVAPTSPPSRSTTQPKPPATTKRTGKKYGPKNEETTARRAVLENIKASTFDDIDRYTAAVQSAENPSDRAALVTTMALDKFRVSGLSPAEVRWLLAEKFTVGEDKRAVEEAMKAQPTSFFLAAPAPFDKRQKLYRPVKGCIDRVQELLRQHDGIASAPSAGGNGHGNNQ